jgi:hypothetical protein
MMMTRLSKEAARIVSYHVLMALAVLSLAGCATEKNTAANRTSGVATPALSFQLPAGWKTAVKDARMQLIVPEKNDVFVWPLADTATVTAAMPKVSALIVGEVKNFKVTSQEDLTIAGSPAKHLVGTGVEADDGDPSNAEVYLFTVGRQVYLACVHGEGADAATLRPTVIKVLNTAKAR